MTTNPTVESTPTPPPATPPPRARRAGGYDATALMPLAGLFVEGSYLADKVPTHEESAHAVLMRCLASGAGTGVVFVVEADVPHPERPLEANVQIVGAIMGEMRPVWHSRKPIAEHLGGFEPDEATGAVLRDAFRKWARNTQFAGCAIIDGVAEKL